MRGWQHLNAKLGRNPFGHVSDKPSVNPKILRLSGFAVLALGKFNPKALMLEASAI